MSDDQVLDDAAQIIADARVECLKLGASPQEIGHIMLDETTLGLITEGAGSAFFAVRGQTLQTAPLTANILPSITREFTLKAAGNIGLKVVAESLTVEQAASADELMIASTTQDTVPVVKFDGKPVADGKPGKYAELLNREFRSFTT